MSTKEKDISINVVKEKLESLKGKEYEWVKGEYSFGEGEQTSKILILAEKGTVAEGTVINSDGSDSVQFASVLFEDDMVSEGYLSPNGINNGILVVYGQVWYTLNLMN